MVKISVLLVSVCVSFIVGRCTSDPGETQTSKVTQSEKKVDTIVKTNTRVVYVKSPDGTETTTTDTKAVSSSKETDTSVSSSKTSTSNKKWSVHLLYGREVKYLLDSAEEIYGVKVDYRVTDRLSVGAFGMTNKVVGVSLGISF